MKSYSVFTGMRDIEIQLEDKNFLYYAEHEDYTPELSQDQLICQALDHPFGADRLDQIPADTKVIIIIDDATRPTPTSAILPYIMERLEKRTRNITFVTAPGTHRPLTEEELESKIVRKWLDRYPVVNVNYKQEDDYEYIGDTEMGTPLYLHKAVLAAEYKIAIGNIAPHNVVGWGGGAKIIMPGVTGEATTSATHLTGSHFPLIDIFGNVNCRMRQEVDAIGAKVGLDFIVNTVLDSDKNILGLFCGHYLEAHRAGVAFAQKALRPEIPALADIVIVSAYPCNMDYWQGFKPLGFSMFGVKRGGTIIYILDPREGFCNYSPAHRDMLIRYLPADAETVYRDVEEGRVTDKVGVTNPLCHFQVLDYTENVICLTNGLTDEECRLLSFQKADTIETALKIAFDTQGQDAKVGIIPFGGETLVRVAD